MSSTVPNRVPHRSYVASFRFEFRGEYPSALYICGQWCTVSRVPLRFGVKIVRRKIREIPVIYIGTSRYQLLIERSYRLNS